MKNDDNWVNQLPENYSGRRLLLQIAAMQGSVEEPRHVIFSIKFKNAHDAKAACRYLSELGWESEIDEASADYPLMVDAGNFRYYFSKDGLERDEEFFRDFAASKDAFYVGWSVVFPLPPS